MIPESAPPRPASAPMQKAPLGAVDTHVHLLAGPDEFALSHARAENPAPGLDMDGFVAAYQAQCETLGIGRAVVVHSILYGADNSVTIEAIRRLGDARGIGLVRDGASEAELDALAGANIKGIRLNYVHGGVLSWDGAKSLAPALAARGMHLQMLVNTDRHLVDLADDIRRLPVPVVLDHIGWPNLKKTPQDPGFQCLLALMADGHVYTKLSGLYRVADAPYEVTDGFVEALSRTPERCLWGSDFPYIMLADAKMPDAGYLLDAFHRVVTTDADRKSILVDTPVRLYGFN